MSDVDLVNQLKKEEVQLPVRPVPFGPVPMSWNVSRGQNENGDPVVIIQVATPEGDKVFFLTAEVGKQLGEAITKISTVETPSEGE